jgi:hypothetical protein
LWLEIFSGGVLLLDSIHEQGSFDHFAEEVGTVQTPPALRGGVTVMRNLPDIVSGSIVTRNDQKLQLVA